MSGVDLERFRREWIVPDAPPEDVATLESLVSELSDLRALRAEVDEFLRAGVPPVRLEDGTVMVFRAPSLKMAAQMLVTDRNMTVEAMRSARDEFAEWAYRNERKGAAAEKLRAGLEGIAEEFESTVRHIDSRGLGGQQVSFHGDFASATQLPSFCSRARWWAKHLRGILDDATKAVAP